MEPVADVETLLRYKAKAVLRQRARMLRNTIPAEAISQRSVTIARSVAKLPEVARASSVALFYPMEQRHEVDLRALDAELRARGALVAYPSIDPQTRVMTFRLTGSLRELGDRGLICYEPPLAAEEAQRLDVVIVPCLQVDAKGHRIGYGAGFYDRALPRFAPPARTVIVAFDFQLISEVPVTEGDVACDVVVTDKRVVWVSSPDAAAAK